MDNTTDLEEHFQKLDECIKDDNKIVTIPSLSRLLNISLTYSQYILSKYVKERRKSKPNELFLTYVLTGTFKDRGKAVVIVRESDLAEKRLTFNKIESEVLFSVQKCKEIDFNVLSLVDDVTQAKKTPLVGSIISKNCTKRVLKVKKLATPPPATIKGKSSFFLPKTQPPIKTEKSSEPVTKTEDKPKGNGIMNMFDKAASKASTEKKPSVDTTKNKQKGGLSAFLSKSASTSNSSIKSETSTKTEISTDSPSALEELMEVDFHELDEVENKIKEEEKKIKEDVQVVKDEKNVKDKKKGANKSEEKKSKNKRQRERSEEKNLKKRKRIIQRNDSESDDMFENDDDVDIIEKSDDEIEPAPSSPAKKPLAPKNRIRKAVDKTYVDDEGFLVTKTEYVFESVPEDDVEAPTKNETEEKPKAENKKNTSSENEVSPAKGAKGKKGKKNNLQNQPTLMNFFKKK